jgi:hypothetical protein
LKDILTISQDEFEKCLPSISIGQLKQLFHAIPEFIQVKKLEGTEMMHDLVRKQTKIQAEMMRRGYLKERDNADFNRWTFARKVKKLW